MAIDFPNSPATGQTYTVGTKVWQYDGEKWSIINTDLISPTEARDLIIELRMEVFL